MEKVIVTGLLLFGILLFTGQSDAKVDDALTTPSDQTTIDTIPNMSGTYTMSHTKDGKVVQFVLEDGVIQALTIDGEKIPAAKFDQYEDMVKELIASVPTPPAPPAPPTPSSVPAPPAPPAPPTPPSSTKKIKVKTKTSSGKDVIIIDDADGTVTEYEIAMDDDGESIIISGIDELATVQAQLAETHTQLARELAKIELLIDSTADAGERFMIINGTDEHDIIIGEGVNGHEVEVIVGGEKKRRRKLTAKEKAALERAEKKLQLAEEKLSAIELKLDEELDELDENTKEQLRLAKTQLQEREAALKALERDVVTRKSSGDKEKMLAEALLADGLIEKTSRYSFELTYDRLEVNGNRMSNAILKRYKALVKDIYNTSFTKGSQIKIKMRPNSRSVSISIVD